MKTGEKDYPIVDGFIDMFCDWLKHRQEKTELGHLDRQTFEGIANDLRVSPAQLGDLVGKGPHSADELPKLLKALGIVEADLARSEPAVLRDMERVCSQCERKVQCNNDIAIGVAARDYEDYCLNAETIHALGKPATAG